jgi:[NiFe] hydrogenase diaphorase moiety large subunit
VIRLCNDVIDRMHGSERVAKAFCEELGIAVGETTPDGKIALEHVPCIGMSDQSPAALINDVVVTHLSSDAAREIVRSLRKHTTPHRLVQHLGDGNNGHLLVQAMVMNNIRKAGPVIFAPLEPGAALGKALAMTPAEVIRDVKTARLRGRGGAGFPTGLKWEFTRKASGEQRYVLCNADEGEPGTFKDRVILTEQPDMIFEGMTICGYAVGADTGIVYLRAEYAYLRPFLEDVLILRRDKGLLGKNVCGQDGFDFDIRIQMGAGAYVCGEETALISSCEGLRGDPKNRPPFPAQKGYLGAPTVVNNVETFCCAARILEKGPGWFAELGSKGSPGTKVLSISGDCKSPGVYELPMGIPLREVLELAGAGDAAAVQVGGPSGTMVGPAEFGREISCDDLATGGSIMVFGPERNVLEVAGSFMEFFIDESCGYCTPCRVGNVLLKERLEHILAGRGEPADLEYLRELGEMVKATSRCGLGQTSPNPVLTTLKNFRPAYEALVKQDKDGFRPSFDLGAALREAETLAGRKSVHSGA